MHRLIKPLFWGLVFIILLAALDQLLTRVPPIHPAHAAVSSFYRDFRSRLLTIVVIPPAGAPQTVEAVIEKERQVVGNKEKNPAAAKRPGVPADGRYVYADAQGVLQFADSLDEIPKAYRGSAERLGE
jgi:hypothetical protein